MAEVYHEEQKKDVTVVVGYFGKMPNQTLSQFLAEWKALGKESQTQLADGIRNGTYDY